MRFRLRTLMIVLALGPAILAGIWFGYQEYKARQGTHLEWGGPFPPPDKIEPIEWDELEGKVRETLAP